MNWRLVGISEFGHRLGEAHHRARLSDATVRRIRDLAEQDVPLRQIARLLGVARSTVWAISRYERRATVADRTVRVQVADDSLPAE